MSKLAFGEWLESPEGQESTDRYYKGCELVALFGLNDPRCTGNAEECGCPSCLAFLDEVKAHDDAEIEAMLDDPAYWSWLESQYNQQAACYGEVA